MTEAQRIYRASVGSHAKQTELLDGAAGAIEAKSRVRTGALTAEGIGFSPTSLRPRFRDKAQICCVVALLSSRCRYFSGSGAGVSPAPAAVPQSACGLPRLPRQQ